MLLRMQYVDILYHTLKVSEAGVHRPHVGGIHGRSNDGSYSLVLAGGFEDEVVGYSYFIVHLHGSVMWLIKQMV